MTFGNDGKENRGKLPPLVDLAFGSRVSHYGNGSKRAAAGEEHFGRAKAVEVFWLRRKAPWEPRSFTELRGKRSLKR
jgi:hypothetical protein